MRSFLIILFVALCTTSFSQSRTVEVFIDNGEYIKGELIAIGKEFMLVRSGDKIESIERDRIQFVLQAKQTNRLRRSSAYSGSAQGQSPGSYRNARSLQASQKHNLLSNKWMSEMSGGLFLVTPFALDMSFTQWKRIGDSWALGLGASWNFSNYSMAKFSLQGRKFVGQSTWFKPFLHASAAFAPTASLFGGFGWGWQFIEFSPVTQGSGGVGFLIDTGARFGLTAHAGVAATFYSTEEQTWDNRLIISSYQHIGPYLLLGLIF